CLLRPARPTPHHRQHEQPHCAARPVTRKGENANSTESRRTRRTQRGRAATKRKQAARLNLLGPRRNETLVVQRTQTQFGRMRFFRTTADPLQLLQTVQTYLTTASCPLCPSCPSCYSGLGVSHFRSAA